MEKNKILAGFGKQLSTVRKEKKIKISELAISTKIAEEKIRKIEAGEVNVRFTTILTLAHGLGIAPDKIVGFKP